MDKETKEAVWKDFWHHTLNRSAPSVVSAEWDAITRAQFDAWSEFAEHISKGALLLDVATGGGRLARMMRAGRPDLKFVGIDIATEFPPAPEGIQFVGGTHLEDLPFEDDSFDGAVSQFGFEYGDVVAGAAEMLRVVKKDGVIALMVHRGDGPILAHNRRRIDQLAWLTEENNLFGQIRDLLPETNELAHEAIKYALDMASRGEEKFGKGEVAWEIPEAIRRTLHLAPRNTREHLIGTLDLIEQQAANERGRILSLAEACAAADDRDTLLAGFVDAGRPPVDCKSVGLSGERPFADLIVL